MGRFSLYWYGQSTGSKLLHLLLAIIVLALIASWLLPTPAQADGYEGTGGYKDDISETRYSRQSDVRNYLTASEKRELRRIHQRAVARRDGRTVRNYRTVAARNDEPTPIRYERRSAPSSLYVGTDGRKCQASVKATGEERGTMARALQSARERWRASVIDELGYGYANLASAIEVRTPAPAIIRYNKFGWPIYVAHIRARPCRAL